MFMPKKEDGFKVQKVIKYASIIVVVYLLITLPLYWYLKSSIDPKFMTESENFVHDKISSLPLKESEYTKTGRYSKINSYFYSRESSNGEIIDIELDTASPSVIYYSIQYRISGKLIIIHAGVGKHETGELFFDSLWLNQ